MSNKKRHQNPSPPVATVPEEEGGETDSLVAMLETPATDSLEGMLANLSPEMRDKARGQLQKLVEQEERTAKAKQFVEFDGELKETLPNLFTELAEKHQVNLSNRRLIITFPNGEFTYSNAVKGSSNGNGNGSRQGFPSGWGTAELHDGDKVTTYKSPSELATVLGLQVQGKRTMVDVFENPSKQGDKTELPKCYQVDAQKGEHFRVTIN